MRWAFSPDSEREPGAVEAASFAAESSSVAPFSSATASTTFTLRGGGSSSSCGGARRRGLRRRCGRAVVELLLRAEQQVEHLRAQALAQRDREHTRDREQQQRASEAAAAAALRGFAQGVRRVAQSDCRLPQFTLELAV